MGEKISQLTSFANIQPSDTVAVVSGGTTYKGTAQSLIRSCCGWFDVAESSTTGQTGLGTGSDHQLLVDAAGANQGGFSYLPNYLASSDVYSSGNSRILIDDFLLGTGFSIRVSGDIYTSTNNVAATIKFKFYDDTDTLIYTIPRYIGNIKTATGTTVGSDTPVQFSTTTNFWKKDNSSTYCIVTISFDAGTNAVDVAGFYVTIGLG